MTEPAVACAVTFVAGNGLEWPFHVKARRPPTATYLTIRLARSTKADCNPLWTATAVPVAHATGACRRMRQYKPKANDSSL
ncbi:hypothetical protein D3093_09260 [Azospirillum argentinense]|uniref:Uncharacterized protein n=1 Tax=Azospirillum argentinense TaxID=2970906 RepID=A0A4D8PII3_9PROT|nr:hypothetical protein D3093_09260 [Azospirillum argentinense]